jgi:hypothetical protein
MIKIIFHISCIGFLALFCTCSALKNTESDVAGVADTAGSKLVSGALGSLTADSARIKLENFIDSLVASTGTSTNIQLIKIRDSVLDNYINLWIQNVVKNAAQSLDSNILDDKTSARLKQELKVLVSQIGPDLLNDSTLFRISMLRDTLLGEQTNNRIKAILDSAASEIIYKLNSGLTPVIKENTDYIEKYAVWFITLAGIIALVIIWFVWMQKEKYLKMTKLMTYQISELPENPIKESIKDNISKNAQLTGIESDLRDLLDKQGLLHNYKKT